jgi:hypothetical protein
MQPYRKQLATVFITLCAACAGYGAAGFHLQKSPAPATPPLLLGPQVNHDLGDRRIDFDCHHVTLPVALKSLADRAGLSLQIDPSDDLNSTRFIELHLHQVKIADAVSAALFAYNPNAGLCWTATNRTLCIASVYDPEKSSQTIVKVYDINPLLPNGFTPVSGAVISNQNQAQTMTISGTPIIITPAFLQSLATDEIKKLITDQIQPSTWKDNGGDIGSIGSIAGLLVIEQTPTAHHQIERLLHLLNGEP